MGYYYQNRTHARTVNNEPSLTEQSMARDTDLNIIVEKFKITGRVPSAQHNPSRATSPTSRTTSGDSSKPQKHQDCRAKLPPQLREMPIEQLLALNPTH